jgi:hypothetical protein
LILEAQVGEKKIWFSIWQLVILFKFLIYFPHS